MLVFLRSKSTRHQRIAAFAVSAATAVAEPDDRSCMVKHT